MTTTTTITTTILVNALRSPSRLARHSLPGGLGSPGSRFVAKTGRNSNGHQPLKSETECAMDYQTAHSKLEHHQLAVVGGLILAFFIAFALMFIHPTASLAVFAIAFGGLIAALVVGAGLKRAERKAAVAALSHEACPKCGAKVEHTTVRPMDWHCTDCGANFSKVGTEVA